MGFLLLVGVFVHRGPTNSSVVLQPEGGGGGAGSGEYGANFYRSGGGWGAGRLNTSLPAAAGAVEPLS